MPMINAGSVPEFLLVLLFTAAGAVAGQTPPSHSSGGNAAAIPQPRTISVDERCRIVSGESEIAGKKRTHPFYDPAICHLESVADSTHREERIAGNQLLRSVVRVKEHELVLRDIADETVMFVVSQRIPENWAIDSDPQPADVEGNTAYFHVYVKPGQTVRLHVGLRRTWPLKPKPI